jgi:phage gpG-like protein
MIGIKLDKMKGMFFDSPKVINAVDKATRNVFSKFGAFVRTTAKSSIRKRKGTSAPGQPPSSHTGLLKKHIYFGYDQTQKSVVIGPAKLNGGTSAPEILEYGGKTVIDYGRTKGKRVSIAARPFMNPAFDKEKPKLPQMWRDSVK